MCVGNKVLRVDHDEHATSMWGNLCNSEGVFSPTFHLLCGEAPVIRSYFHVSKKVTFTHTQTHAYLQDGNAMLWDLNEGKHLYTLNGGEVINALVFSPNRYWLCAATGQSVKIWVSQLNISPCTKLLYQSLALSLSLSLSLIYFFFFFLTGP